jgi:hypothetical protein
MEEDEEFVAPRPNPVMALAVAAILVTSVGLGSAFSLSAMDYVQVWWGADEFAQVKGEVTRASTIKEGSNTRPDIAFAYEVGGETYEADSRWTATSYKDAELARRASQKQKVGDAVTVFYAPGDPKLATLTREVSPAPAFIRVGYALAFWVVAIVSVVGWKRSRARTRAAAYARHVQAKARERRAKKWSESS